MTRFLDPEDILRWVEFFSEKETTEFFPNLEGDTNEEKAKAWIEKQFTRYKENRLGLQALIHKQEKYFIGQCGLLTQEVDGIMETEVSYHLLKRYWGNGYAPEAARMFINFAFANNLADSVISIIDIRNRNSQRVAEKNGLKIDKQTKWRELDVYIYRIRKNEWADI